MVLICLYPTSDAACEATLRCTLAADHRLRTAAELLEESGHTCGFFPLSDEVRSMLPQHVRTRVLANQLPYRPDLPSSVNPTNADNVAPGVAIRCGQRVMVTRNIGRLRLANGNLATVVACTNGTPSSPCPTVTIQVDGRSGLVRIQSRVSVVYGIRAQASSAVPSQVTPGSASGDSVMLAARIMW